MIIKRKSQAEEERDYSYKAAKKAVEFRAKMKGAGNSIMTPINNLGLKVGNVIKEIATGKPTSSQMKAKFVPKSKKQLMEESVKEINGAKRNAKLTAINTAVGANKAVKSIMENPGGTTGKLVNEFVIQPTTKAPVTSIAFKLAPVPGASAFHKMTVAPIEAGVWDRSGIGRITKPIRSTIGRYVNNNTMSGAGQGIYNGLRSSMGA